ncbi:large conductance mechanosensitive channel protein MscL [Kushneria phosphatilytica]|uniref:Large-conductance mechanosensitive channel n=1 Tax=Kushneria phosphatilytica TaxID=657387 RepID=A0A1S1NRS7_9GAMM|nr:large conductance mechanosensitive channel protein MscL [Kushneria phosphatilytica]OHV11964.1 mechanosensitive ion channel protein MscL [Kushneria phosphatilytica]QEL11149.1 large conductance mechanosensitive channel protein MscL [Kushneria phosphatilytica]
MGRSGFLKEFRDFAVRGNVVDMAVGIVVGTAFTAIVSSLVKDIFSPLIGLITGGMNFANLFLVVREGATAGPYTTLADAQAAGAVTVNYGLFINAAITFVIVAFVAFLLVRSINRLKNLHHAEAQAPEAPTTKSCPYCVSKIPVAATRCPACTSQLEESAEPAS